MEQVMKRGEKAEGRSKIFKEFVIITVQKKKKGINDSLKYLQSSIKSYKRFSV